MYSITLGSGNNKKILDKMNKFPLALLANSILFTIGKNAFYNATGILKVIMYASIRGLSIEGSSEELTNLCNTYQNKVHLEVSSP